MTDVVLQRATLRSSFRLHLAVSAQAAEHRLHQLQRLLLRLDHACMERCCGHCKRIKLSTTTGILCNCTCNMRKAGKACTSRTWRIENQSGHLKNLGRFNEVTAAHSSKLPELTISGFNVSLVPCRSQPLSRYDVIVVRAAGLPRPRQCFPTSAQTLSPSTHTTPQLSRRTPSLFQPHR